MNGYVGAVTEFVKLMDVDQGRGRFIWSCRNITVLVEWIPGKSGDHRKGA